MIKKFNMGLNDGGKQISIANAEDLPADRHTDEIQEIITKVPSWILRWGITLFFCILLMAACISTIIRYPDTIKGNLKIESSVYPKPVTAVLPGRVNKVLINKGESVKKGQVLAYVESSGNAANIYPLIAGQDGKAAFVAIVQPGIFLSAHQEVFNIHPENEHFFGIMQIPKNSIYKVKEGQEVLIKLTNYPGREFGQFRGEVSYIADEPVKEGFFAVKITFRDSGVKKTTGLKNWMTADAEIITDNISLQQRMYKSILKGL